MDLWAAASPVGGAPGPPLGAPGVGVRISGGPPTGKGGGHCNIVSSCFLSKNLRAGRRAEQRSAKAERCSALRWVAATPRCATYYGELADFWSATVLESRR